MSSDTDLIHRIYARFNARDLDGVLALLDEDVTWANGMDGGHVQGREAVRAYWVRQWAVVSPEVQPMDVRTTSDGAILVAVRQTIRDLDGQSVLADAHGLASKTVHHLFHMRDGKVVRFDIREADPSSDGDPARLSA